MAWFRNHYLCARCGHNGPTSGRPRAMTIARTAARGTCRRTAVKMLEESDDD